MACNVETNGTPQVPPTTMNLFPVDNNKSGDVPKRVDCSTVTNMNKFEPQTAEMTIFYGGQVIVFNNFPADKAKEIMLLASNSSRARSSPIESGIGVSPTSKADKPAQQPLPSDLPIARRASLHRFLEKRKDRIASKAPYQITSSDN
ncbi:jasmonate-zim-domain protein 1 [Hibiscus trionum]|uniref:Protein TIFY n=1 Tax=Hibiscus trionum TaxID=183268 RepID=A0A9W7LY48_HIBTR|nr:jasmonate-zim-domain protein 1 [Hibiscus trionum]